MGRAARAPGECRLGVDTTLRFTAQTPALPEIFVPTRAPSALNPPRGVPFLSSTTLNGRARRRARGPSNRFSGPHLRGVPRFLGTMARTKAVPSRYTQAVADEPVPAPETPPAALAPDAPTEAERTNAQEAERTNAPEQLHDMFDPDTGLPNPCHINAIRQLHRVAYGSDLPEALFAGVLAAHQHNELHPGALDFTRQPPFPVGSAGALAFEAHGGVYSGAVA